MNVYGYCRNPCTYESAECTVSLHLTKAGAWRALRKTKWELAVGGREYHLMYGGAPDIYREPDWATHKVREFEVLP